MARSSHDGRSRRTARAVAALLVSAALVVAPTTAIALEGDGGDGSYAPGSGTNNYIASVRNTETTKHLYDYISISGANSVTACSVVSGFPAGSSCIVNGGGFGTAEVAIGSGGLVPGATSHGDVLLHDEQSDLQPVVPGPRRRHQLDK